MEALQEQQQELDQKPNAETIDFKMVTFSLGGKEYGIDIMMVKEISKADRFTYVPNTAPYVRGVYNLRGDIISIIDLRVLFHLPAPSRADGAMEDMIILRLESSFIGVIVDSIDKVVGISSQSIQAPHPLFGDINIKFIKGIIENEKRLYIILDVEKILGGTEEEESRVEVMGIPMAGEHTPEEPAADGTDEPSNLGIEFLQDTLKTFKRFIVTDINRQWVHSRYSEWKRERGGTDENAQLKSPEEAEEFLTGFYSPHSGELWSDEYSAAVAGLLPENRQGNLSAWNAGCGKGYETYSLTVLLKKRNPEALIKVWANENDLLSISTAPNLILTQDEIPPWLGAFVEDGKNGKQFTAAIRDQILFEYHDVLHPNPIPEVDLILARDIVSFMPKTDQNRLLQECNEKLKPGGILLLGANEEVTTPDWELVESSGIVAYRKKSEELSVGPAD